MNKELILKRKPRWSMSISKMLKFTNTREIEIKYDTLSYLFRLEKC